MLIYGTNGTHLKSMQSTTATCPNCGTKGSLLFSIFGQYAHVYWIPLFPIGKKGGMKCQNCHAELENNALSGELKQEYNTLKSQVSTPIWNFAGLGIIAVIAVIAYFASVQDKKSERDYIASPEVADVYTVELDNGYYSTLKVTEETQDSVFIQPNNYETNKMSGISDIDEEEKYSDEIYVMSKQDLIDMYEEGNIADVTRR